MTRFGCSCNCNPGSECSILAIIASIIIGIVTTLLTITAVIAVTPAFLWVLLGIAVVYLAVLLLATASFRCTHRCRCLRTPLGLAIAGILGTVLTSIILLAITFSATSVIGAIITGALLLFFSLLITSTACIVKCFAGVNNVTLDDCD